MAVAAVFEIHIEINAAASPTAASRVAGERAAQGAPRIASAIRRSSAWRLMARPMNMPPSRKNTVGLPKAARAVRAGSSLPSAPAGTAPMATANTSAPKPVAAIGIGSVIHQMIVSSSTPERRWASGVSPSRGPNASQATSAAGPRSSPQRSHEMADHDDSRWSCTA